MPADPPHTIIIWGLGREGKSSYQYLRQQYPETNFLLTDDQVLAQLDPAWRQSLDQDELATFRSTPELTPAQLSSILNKTNTQVMVVKTAGMPPRHPFHQILAQLDSTITSNTQLFFDFARENQIKTIGVTGTKGKSTTAALIYHTLSLATLPVVFGGNIGTPPLDMIETLQARIDENIRPIAVLELSSHQLANLKTSPHIAVIQNITPEHLDYYASFQQYAQAKQAVARYQTPDDLVIFNSHYDLPHQLAQSGQAKQMTFSINASTLSKTDVAHVANDTIYYRNQPIIGCDQVTLLGAHNLDNILPTVIVAKQMAIADSDIVRSLTSFQPLPHRLELVAEIDGVKYINDSLSTTPVATIAALQTFSDQPVVLIAGGYDRGLDYGDLAEFLSTHPVQALILFQPSGQRIKDLLTSVKFPIEFADDMAQAVNLAKKYATVGNVVLLSPGSASFGQFKDYAERGQAFGKEVTKNVA